MVLETVEMTFRNCICVLLLVGFFSFTAAAQKPALSFKHLTSTHGLSQNHVYCIIQDYHGFMWFGTQDGLNKYDGYRFNVYKNNPKDSSSISGNFVRAVFEDKEKNLWIGTISGLNLYNRQTDSFTQFKNDPADPQSISHNEITSVHEDRDGNLWIGTMEGLNLLNKKDKTFTRYKNDKNDPSSLSDSFIWSIYEDSKRNLWIGTSIGGLNLFDRASKKFTSYMPRKGDGKSITSDYVTTILEDKKGNLWVGTTIGLNLFDRDKKTFRQYVHHPKDESSIGNNMIYSMLEDSKGNFWIGTLNSGLNLFHEETGTFSHYLHDPYNTNSISNNTPSAIYEDRSGTLWVGVHRGGVNYFNPVQEKFTTYRQQPYANSISNNNIKCLAEDKFGLIWIGTEGGELNVFDRKSNSFKQYRHDPKDPHSISSNIVLSALSDSRGDLWIGTLGGGLNKFDHAKDHFIRYRYEPADPNNTSQTDIWYIQEDNESNLWIGDDDTSNENGFYIYDRKTNRIRKRLYYPDVHTHLSQDDIRLMYRDSRDNLWMGTFRGGLNLFDPRTDKIARYLHDENDPKSISSNEMLCAFEDSKKRLWIGTRTGLNLFNPETGTFKVYTQSNGLPNNVIQSITEDDKGNLWLGTLMGLCRFNPESGVVKNYTEADGLQSNEFSRGVCLKTKDGLLIFGGINGFSTFYPDSIRENAFIPPVYITNFEIFNKPVAIGGESPLKAHINEAKEIVLPHEASVFSFEFAALNYNSPEKNQYAYMLEGFDEYWNFVGNKRTATYTNLDPGTYIFKVRASNNDGIWNEEPTMMKIIVTPPFWLTWWFLTLAGTFIVALLITIYRVRVSGIKRQKHALERLVQQRTEEIATQNEQLLEQQKELELQRNSLAVQNKTIEEKNNLLENQQVHLEKLVDERTLELLNINMELKDKNQRLEQYGFMTSHNFRGPVATLLGLFHIFNKKQLGDPENLVYIEKMEETTLKIDDMIKDMSVLLDQDTHIETLFENVWLEDVMQNVKVLLAQDIKESNVKITHDFSAVPFVRAVPAYINSMFYNLISNAIKFRKDDEVPVIEIIGAETTDLILITFKDNGAGIDLEKHSSSIFHPFKRFQTNVPGKGLGLYLVKTQMKAMNAEIQLESKKGVGTTFRLLFKRPV